MEPKFAGSTTKPTKGNKPKTMFEFVDLPELIEDKLWEIMDQLPFDLEELEAILNYLKDLPFRKKEK